MHVRIKHISLAAISLGALVAAIPVLGQDSPESLLPPGFGEPAPAPAPRPAPAVTPTPAPGPVPSRPVAPQASDPSSVADTEQDVAETQRDLPALSLDDNGDVDLETLDDVFQAEYTLTEGERRSTDEIGVLTPQYKGLPNDAFGEEGGLYLTSLIKNLNGPILSRWGSILLRRALLSKVTSPENVNPADWTAERAWRLLRMGEADAARALVLKVDGGNYTPRLYEVAMQAHLATADPAGICPLVDAGARVSDAPTWVMFRPICASFTGEQSRATRLLQQAGATGQPPVSTICSRKKPLGPGSKDAGLCLSFGMTLSFSITGALVWVWRPASNHPTVSMNRRDVMCRAGAPGHPCYPSPRA